MVETGTKSDYWKVLSKHVLKVVECRVKRNIIICIS